jgi:hypothetical protein
VRARLHPGHPYTGMSWKDFSKHSSHLAFILLT